MLGRRTSVHAGEFSAALHLNDNAAHVFALCMSCKHGQKLTSYVGKLYVLPIDGEKY